MSDIRKWFMKKHDKDSDSTQKPSASEKSSSAPSQQEKIISDPAGNENSGRKKTSKYFANDKTKSDKEQEIEISGKRKALKEEAELKPPPHKKQHIVDKKDADDFVSSKTGASTTPTKKLKSVSGRGVVKKSEIIDESDEDDIHKNQSKSRGRGSRGRGASKADAVGRDMDIDESDEDDIQKNQSKGRGRGSSRGRGASKGEVVGRNMDVDDNEEDDDEKDKKPAGRGRGGRAASASPAAGRGRGWGGRGGFANFGERKDPPHKGEKEVPEGAPTCLAGLTIVISGTLDSLEREEAEDLIKRHGGRVTGSISKKTSFLLCDEDVEGRKSSKAKELGTPFLTEDQLFDKIRASNKGKTPVKEVQKKPMEKVAASPIKKSPLKELKKEQDGESPVRSVASKISGISSVLRKDRKTDGTTLPWTEKYRPKVFNDIVGNQSIVKQLHDWLSNWDAQFLNTGTKGKGKKQSDSGAKKAVLLSGPPGIGKTTTSKVVCQLLGFQTTEVDASVSRGKADSKIEKGVGGSTSNTNKELVSNAAFRLNKDQSKYLKSVLIMDEVDGMSAGDRGGVADLIASIKISKIPIICICNDRYSQKLKSLVNYCDLLNFRKPTKQQMAKRLMQIAKAEGLQANEVTLEELADRVNGDIRMALNQLQYMSLSMSTIKYDDIRQRLLSSAKDEDISPFTAVDKLFGFNGGKLRMDERIDLSMSDPDLVPLIVQENYINYRPSSGGKDDSGIKRMNLIAQAAESIADGDIVNVQIRKYRQWQLSPFGSLVSCIIPAALLHGQREILTQGERNFNRFGGWLGKNSTTGKNLRILDDMHIHLLASRGSSTGRSTMRVDFFTPLLKHLTLPLRNLPKDEGVQSVVEFMDAYSLSMDDFDGIVDMSKFQSHPNPLDGIPPAVKSALTRAYNKGSLSRVVRTADLITLPGIKKVLKKRVAAMLEPVDEEGLQDGNTDASPENEETSDAENTEDGDENEKNAEVDLQNLKSRGIQVQMDLKGGGGQTSSAKKAPSGRGKGGGSASVDNKKGGRGSGSASRKK
ncbi:replication factor C subunit 1-like [Impatiens glandulifera]|uniref:replication factor C subunit 1-like n=1 Tax=Impatiens glandulifera TaxID=253017 RepID=UPI001FB13382|nr:replication factor C subunit 1-like [Impatiens glandulifera]XP_047324595.1 replication factor C subunit 1-like [Impatiens glandulifera]